MLCSEPRNPEICFDEMRAVESSYTFLIQDEGLPKDDMSRNLLSRIDDNRLFRFHTRPADYASALCNVLKDSKEPSLI